MNKLILSKKMIASCFLASCLEIYDFVLFAFLTPLLKKNYFTFLEEETVLIVSYILLAVGFVFRPLGSLIFGYIGDIYGRQRALVMSVSLMGGCSLTMFLLPSYEMIGIWSCIIIVLVRVIQGVSVGGEFTGALVFAIEHVDKKNAGLVGGVLAGGGAAGVLLASIVSNFLKNPIFPDYSWRIAFLLGFGLAIIGYVIRKKLTETPVFQSLKDKKDSIPLLEGLKLNKIKCINTVLIAAANGSVFYFAVIFLPSYLTQTTELNTKYLSVYLTCLILIFAPIGGYLSDRLNRGVLLATSCFVMALYLPVMLQLVTSINESNALILYFVAYCLIFSVMASTINTFAIEIFPAKYRMSCSSLCYSLGMGLMGGTVPTVSAFIVHWFGEDPIYVSIYISLICLLAGTSTLFILINKNKYPI